jgi:hypothetical protein
MKGGTMGAQAEEKITDPHELFSQSRFTEAEIEELVAVMNPEGHKEFMRQVFEAAALTSSEGDLRPVHQVLESWFRTLMFVKTPGLNERATMARMDKTRFTKQDIEKRRAALA